MLQYSTCPRPSQLIQMSQHLVVNVTRFYRQNVYETISAILMVLEMAPHWDLMDDWKNSFESFSPKSRLINKIKRLFVHVTFLGKGSLFDTFNYSMDFEFHSDLAADLGKLLDDADDYNVEIRVGEEPNVKSFQSHSVILRGRSPYFRTALSSNWARKDGEKFVLKQPNISPTVFEIIHKWVQEKYGARV